MRYIAAVFFAVLLGGCDFIGGNADSKFGQQHFVSAISAIELYKMRNGTYPSDLSALKYLGDWDKIWLASVKYERTSEGYNLYIERGVLGKPNVELPTGFKVGLGIKDTNVIWVSE